MKAVSTISARNNVLRNLVNLLLVDQSSARVTVLPLYLDSKSWKINQECQVDLNSPFISK